MTMLDDETVVALPGGWRVYDDGTQWQVQAPQKSDVWRTEGFYMTGRPRW